VLAGQLDHVIRSHTLTHLVILPLFLLWDRRARYGDLVTIRKTEESRFDRRREKEIPLSSKVPRPALGHIRVPIQWAPEALCPEVKLLGCKAVHPPQYTEEIKKLWSSTSLTPYTSMVCTGIISHLSSPVSDISLISY
jgi:hypothetical protein